MVPETDSVPVAALIHVEPVAEPVRLLVIVTLPLLVTFIVPLSAIGAELKVRVAVDKKVSLALIVKPPVLEKVPEPSMVEILVLIVNALVVPEMVPFSVRSPFRVTARVFAASVAPADTDKLPLMAVVALKVVAPPDMLRLLKVVKLVERVKVPVKTTVPPVLVKALRCTTVKLPAVSTAPVVMVTVPLEPVPPAPPNVTAPATVTSVFELKTSVPELLLTEVEPSWMLAHCAPVTFTVRVLLVITTMASLEEGTPPGPDPVVMLLQFVFEDMVTVAPRLF
jgi:hypothetical protein